MGKYKHQTVPQLRGELRDVVAYRRKLNRMKKKAQEVADESQREADQIGKHWHNMGQREAAIRLALAQKELERAN